MSREFTARWLICRICLKSENNKLYNIFDPIAEEKLTDLGTSLADKIEIYGCVKLDKQPNLPNKICDRCVLLLRAAYKFRDLCQQSQNQLKQFLSQKEESSEEYISIANFDSDAEEQKTEAQEEVCSEILPEDYVIEESVEYEDLSYQQEEGLASRNDLIDTIADVKYHDLNDENSNYEVEIDDMNMFASEEDGDQITVFKYDEDPNGDNITTEEQLKKPEGQRFKKRNNVKKPATRRKRKQSQTESGIYRCIFCVNTYTDKTKYNNHMKIHIKDKPHECEICKKCFSTTPQLSRHMNSHTGNRPYKCQYCDACFGDPSTKIKHERIHTNERPYKCFLCSKAFAYSNVLKVHMMTHTGEKPHTCDYCGRNFSQLHHKNAHERRHKKVDMDFLTNSPDRQYLEEDNLNTFKIEEII